MPAFMTGPANAAARAVQTEKTLTTGLTAHTYARLHLPLGLHAHALPAAEKQQRRQQGHQQKA